MLSVCTAVTRGLLRLLTLLTMLLVCIAATDISCEKRRLFLRASTYRQLRRTHLERPFPALQESLPEKLCAESS